ncbi:cyclic diguanylate phosphodiesterase [Escherichia coli]
MQKAQRIIKTYRRNRMIVCTICALVTLASTLSVRFISQRNLNQQRVVQFANHAVEELDKVLLPLQAGSEVLLPLIGLPCSVAHLPLRKQAAKLQTVRSIGLVQDGTLYCSSIFGIVPLTRYVMAETIRQRHVFPMSSQFHVGINVAPSHFRRGVLIKDLNQYWFSAHPIQQLILEITERDALLDVDYRIARELHRKNVKLAIDDFGTGNSSFSWLETLRPDVLKIDKSFTAAIGSDAVNSTVTDIIIALGQRLNIELVAEGVETQEQAKYLRRHGVHILQGYLYAQPMPLRDFPKWLAGSQPPPARHNGHITPIMPLR